MLVSKKMNVAVLTYFLFCRMFCAAFVENRTKEQCEQQLDCYKTKTRNCYYDPNSNNWDCAKCKEGQYPIDTKGKTPKNCTDQCKSPRICKSSGVTSEKCYECRCRLGYESEQECKNSGYFGEKYMCARCTTTKVDGGCWKCRPECPFESEAECQRSVMCYYDVCRNSKHDDDCWKCDPPFWYSWYFWLGVSVAVVILGAVISCPVVIICCLSDKNTTPPISRPQVSQSPDVTQGSGTANQQEPTSAP